MHENSEQRLFDMHQTHVPLFDGFVNIIATYIGDNVFCFHCFVLTALLVQVLHQ